MYENNLKVVIVKKFLKKFLKNFEIFLKKFLFLFFEEWLCFITYPEPYWAGNCTPFQQ